MKLLKYIFELFVLIAHAVVPNESRKNEILDPATDMENNPEPVVALLIHK